MILFLLTLFFYTLLFFYIFNVFVFLHFLNILFTFSSVFPYKPIPHFQKNSADLYFAPAPPLRPPFPTWMRVLDRDGSARYGSSVQLCQFCAFISVQRDDIFPIKSSIWVFEKFPSKKCKLCGSTPQEEIAEKAFCI